MIFIKNWSKHQSSGKLEKIRQNQAERVKRYREKQKDCNVTVTLHDPLEVRSKKEEVRRKNKEIKESVTIDKNCNVTENRCSSFSNLEIPNNSEIQKPEEEETADKASLDGEKEKAQVDRKAQEKPSKKKDQEKERLKQIASDVLKFLNETTGKHFRLTQPFQGMINARIADGYSMDDLKIVIRKKTLDWKGTEWEKYLAPDTLFGPKKFDKYLNQPWPRETRQPPKGGISSWDEVPEAEEYA
jgi:uncharacterized phage protein (TIGR02220 family)